MSDWESVPRREFPCVPPSSYAARDVVQPPTGHPAGVSPWVGSPDAVDYTTLSGVPPATLRLKARENTGPPDQFSPYARRGDGTARRVACRTRTRRRRESASVLSAWRWRRRTSSTNPTGDVRVLDDH